MNEKPFLTPAPTADSVVQNFGVQELVNSNIDGGTYNPIQ